MRWLRDHTWGRGERRSVELTPDEQIALGELLRFGEASGATLSAAIEATRGTRFEPAEKALRDLQSKGLMAVARKDGAEAHYRPTALGRKLRGRLADDPKSTVEFYV